MHFLTRGSWHRRRHDSYLASTSHRPPRYYGLSAEVIQQLRQGPERPNPRRSARWRPRWQMPVEAYCECVCRFSFGMDEADEGTRLPGLDTRVTTCTADFSPSVPEFLIHFTGPRSKPSVVFPACPHASIAALYFGPSPPLQKIDSSAARLRGALHEAALSVALGNQGLCAPHLVPHPIKQRAGPPSHCGVP